jgi:hypothetical protein
MEMSQYDYE